VKAPVALGIGNGAHFRLSHEDEIPLANAGEELAHVAVGQPHTAVGDGTAEQALVVGAVEVDVALKRVAARPPVHAVLEPFEGEDTGEDEIVVTRLSAPRLAGRLAGSEHRAGVRVLPDPPVDAMPAWRRAV